MKANVQISLDITNIDEALETAALAMRAGIDWLEAAPPSVRLFHTQPEEEGVLVC
jgi:3-hexulose-6-phosphate synthase